MTDQVEWADSTGKVWVGTEAERDDYLKTGKILDKDGKDLLANTPPALTTEEPQFGPSKPKRGRPPIINRVPGQIAPVAQARAGFKEGEVIGNTGEAVKQEAKKFIVDAAHTRIFWNGLVFPTTKHITRVVDGWLEINFHIPDDQFKLSPRAETVVTDQNPDNLWARAASGFCVILGAKTQEEAHLRIDSLETFSAFGGLMIVIGMHYAKAYKESPKLAKMREKAKLDKLRRAALKDPESRKAMEKTEMDNARFGNPPK